jgi:hypothetical protein
MNLESARNEIKYPPKFAATAILTEVALCVAIAVVFFQLAP